MKLIEMRASYVIKKKSRCIQIFKDAIFCQEKKALNRKILSTICSSRCCFCIIYILYA